jgi:hypothetical protein
MFSPNEGTRARGGGIFQVRYFGRLLVRREAGIPFLEYLSEKFDPLKKRILSTLHFITYLNTSFSTLFILNLND